MEKPYSPFPNNTNEEPNPNSSQPRPRPHVFSSSSSSAFAYHHRLPIPPPCLHPLQPFTVNPPFSQSLNEPFWVGPAVPNPVSYSGQTAHNFSGPINSSNMTAASRERRVAQDAWSTKIARTKRKMARQKSLNLNLSSSSGDPSAPFLHSYYDDARNNISMHEAEESSNNPKDPYDFITEDNKKLKVILKKELKNSDVGSLGRIVIPKRDAEENLPSLNDKEGIQVVIRDINSNRGWSVKYKYWSNNKSRMYVLENTGDFVKENGLQIGDTITLYEDMSHNIYFSIKKAEKSLQELLQKPYPNPHYYQGSFQVPPPATAHEEEDVALALLIEQLRHREHQEVTLQLMDYPSSSQHMDPAESCTFNSITNQDNSTSSNNNPGTHFDEYYGGLDLLHGSNPCTSSFLDQWSGGSGEDQ